MKKLILVAALGLAVLTACSDDSSSSANDSVNGGTVSCDVVASLGVDTSHVCTEVDASSSYASQLRTGCVSMEGFMVATLGTGCPSDYKKVCSDVETSNLEYFYDEKSANVDCETLTADDDSSSGEIFYAIESSSSEKVTTESSSSVEAAGQTDDVVSCDVVISIGTYTEHTCSEVDASFVTDDASAECSASGDGYSMTLGTGCPSGAKKVCDVSDMSLYFYDDGTEGMDCSDLTSTIDEEE